jgi:hypothetical protein
MTQRCHGKLGVKISNTGMQHDRLVPEFIDPLFVKTSPKRSYSVIEDERFGLVFAKTGSIISGTGGIGQGEE